MPKARFSGRPFPAKFTDVAREVGLTARFVQGTPTRKQYIIEANGTGVAFLDYDGDGWQDVFLVNGRTLAASPAGQEPTSHLYRNTKDGRFVDVTRQAGLTLSGWGNGVCGGDYDNDGKVDLYVTYWGNNSLYRNLGNGTFSDVAAKAGVAKPKGNWSTGCAFVDYDRDGRLDLLVGSYVEFDLKTAPRPGEKPYCLFRETPVYCGPRGLPYGSLTLYRGKPDGTFEDTSESSGIRKARDFYAFTATAVDLTGDGWPDLYVASDSTPSLLFRNNRDGTFTEVGTESSVAYNEHGAEQAGMGVAIGDYDNDGWLDLTKTNFIRDYPNLYRNLGKGLFEDMATAAGLGVNPQYVLWGTGLEDLDNDGWRDVFQVGGHVYPEIEKIDPRESYANPRLVYRNLGNGAFEDVSSLAGPGVAARHASHGAAFGDYDNDGDIDVLVMNMDEPPSLLRNDTPTGRHWLGVSLEGKESNRSAIGSIITLETGAQRQTAAILSQASFLSMNDLRAHFGLGGATTVSRLTVRWPSGKSEQFGVPAIDRHIVLLEGSGTAQ